MNIISRLEHPSILKFIGYSPIDFNKKQKPVIITEFSINGSLGELLELERMKKKIKGWDDTKKLICIYGIAKGMAYLHSHDIIHRDLKPDNIFLDDFLFPKIADFGLSKIYNDPSINASNLKTTEEIKGTPIYIAPEIWLSLSYSAKCDVYSYSFIIYEIITTEKPFKDYNIYSLMSDVSQKGIRPEFKNEIPECYQNLIKSCWSQQPENRPTFDEIVEQLKNDPAFITENVDKDDFHSYIEFLDASQSSYDSSKKLVHLSDFNNFNNKTYKKVSLKKMKKKILEQKNESGM